MANASTGPRTGSAWVVFGSASRETVDAGTLEESGRGYWIKGAFQGDSTGYSVAGIGDVNGDGRPDALIGAYGYDPVDPANPAAALGGAGAAYVVYGKADTAPVELSALASEQGYRIDGLGAGDRFGRQVAAVGDVDANGGADFAIGGDFAVRESRSQAGEVRLALLPALEPAPDASPGLPVVHVDDPVTASASGEVNVTLLCPADTSGCRGSARLRSGWRDVSYKYLLVPANRGSSFWSIYENGRSQVALVAADGRQLAFYDPDFAVFNPSRYASSDGTQTTGRTVDLCFEVELTGDAANREPCTALSGPVAFDDPASPFDGAKREFYLGETTVRNAGGPTVWYTDPYGTNGSARPFPGSVRQYVARVDNSGYPPLSRRLMGRGSDYGGNGVHAPN